MTMDVSKIGAAYGRMSTTMQNERSPEDQVAVCRRKAAEFGIVIPDENVFIDKAVSGTLLERDGLERLKEAVEQRRFGVLVVEDFSRLSRESTHLMPLLKQWVFQGLRIISATEGVDTASESWTLLAAILGIQHERYVSDLSQRVRRGKVGHVQEDLAVGDHCFGYRTEPIEGSEKQRKGRDGRPKKRILIDTEQARWVRQVFEWFAVDQRSYSWISRELTRLGVPKDHRGKQESGWHHSVVRQLLRNRKYIGEWVWGRSRNKRNPATGITRQEPAPAEDIITRTREDLRIISDDLWQLADERRKEIKELYKDRLGRPKQSYVEKYPKNEFSGLVFCRACGHRMCVGGSHNRYLYCPGKERQACTVRTYINRSRLQHVLLERIRDEALAAAENVDEVLELVRTYVDEQQRKVPSELESLRQKRSGIAKEIKQLMQLHEVADRPLKAVATRLAELEQQAEGFDAEITKLEAERALTVAVPDRDWLLNELRDLHELDDADPQELAALFRAFTGGRIEMTEKFVPGRISGFPVVHFSQHVVDLAADRAQRKAAARGVPAAPAAAEGAATAVWTGGARVSESAQLLKQALRNRYSRPAAEIELRLPKKPRLRVAEIADEVVRLREEGLTIAAIGKRLHCASKTIYAAFAAAEGKKAS